MKAILENIRRLARELAAQLQSKIGHDAVLTDRLKLLISIGAVVLILAGLLGTRQIVSALEQRYVKAQIDIARLQAQIERGGWQDRKQQSQTLKSLLEERMWTAQTPGLADASFERWLRDRLNQYKIEPLQPIQPRRVPVIKQGQPGETQSALSDVQRMTAKIILPFDSAATAGFLADLADADKVVVVDRLVIRSGRNARVEVDVSGFFRSHERP